MTPLTPADIARLDQAHAEGMADLERMVKQVRADIAADGFTLAAARLTAELMDPSLPPQYLAAMAGLAIAQLAAPAAPAGGAQ